MKYTLSNDTWGKEELDAISRVVQSRQFTMGENVSKFEKQFAAKFSSKFAIMSNSGSSANLLAISSLVYSGRLQKGDEILVPAVSWSTTYFPIDQCGLKVRIVDIDRETLNVDVSKIENSITKRTKAILAVNLLGNPNDFSILMEICERNNLLLIEDNCESMGAEYHSKKTGTFGILGTFSSFYSHHICTMEGGVTVTNDEELYHYMLAIRAHGWTRQLPKKSKLHVKNENPFYESFQFILPGYNLRPLEMEAAVGMEQLKKLKGFIDIRRQNAKLFKEMFSHSNRFSIQKEIGKSSWFGFAVILKDEEKGNRDKYVEKLQKANIDVRPVVAGNFFKQAACKHINVSIPEDGLHNADYIHDNGFFVGNHSELLDEKIIYLHNVLEK